MFSVNRPHDDGILCSLVLPAYNARPIIQETLAALDRFLLRSELQWEVVFVSDGCTDGTDLLMADWVDRNRSVARLLALPVNRGKGYAVRCGLAAAHGQYRVFTDIDLAYGLEEVCKVVDRLRAGVDMAIASRTCPESEILLPADMVGYAFCRKLQSTIFSTLVRGALGIPFRDTQAGLKGLSASAAERLLPCLQCTGFEFDCEWLAAAQRLGLSVAEVPVRVRYERGQATTTGLRSMVHMVRGLLAIRNRVRRLNPPLEAVLAPERRRAA